MFEHTVTARFYDIDRAGIVFFGRFFEYCHATFEEMLVAAFGDWWHHFEQRRWGLPLVHVESDFSVPVQMGERLRVTVDLEKVGHKSLTFVHDILGRDGVRHARIRLVRAFIDPVTFRAIQVDPEFVAGLRRAGVATPDHVA